MLKGLFFCLSACFAWAFIYVVPLYITGFSSIEITLGRYLVYGLLSLTLYFHARKNRNFQISRRTWVQLLKFSLICTIGYYIFLLLSMRYATPAISALVLGISPVTCAIYGNWMQKEISFRKLILPCALILIGLFVMNWPHLKASSNAGSYLFGLGCSAMALAAWTWYVEANSRFLKQNPDIQSGDWATLIGIGTLIWVFVFALILILFFPGQLRIEKYFVLNTDLASFVIGSLILGILCSWIAETFWNKASLFLPVSLIGQLTIFETVFAVVLVLLIEERIPLHAESIGIAIQFLGIFYGIQQFAKNNQSPARDYPKEETCQPQL